MTHDSREVDEWKKLAREKLVPNVTYIDPKFSEVASWAQELLNAFWVEQQKDLDTFIETIHQQLQKAREEERKIIKLRIDYDRRKGIPAEETVNDIYDSIELKDHSELDQDKQ